MVYQFPLPPLVLHTFRTANATALVNWLRGLEQRTPGTAFFNFLASHDGIGVVPASGLIAPEDVQALATQVEQHGGRVNYRNTPEGAKAYELCTTLFDALSDPNSNEAESLKINRFLAANAILLALQGVPGIYVHSVFGSPNDHAGLAASGINRRLNRHKFSLTELEALLDDPRSRASQVLARYSKMLAVRSSHAAFAPDVAQQVMTVGRSVLVIVRGEEQPVTCLINVSGKQHTWMLEPASLPAKVSHDLLSGRNFEATITLEPYEVLWLV
jgi:sucrose phosphorylase